MADFSLDKKYNYLWQNSKFKDFAQSGSLISQFVNDAGYVTSTSGVDTGSFVTTSSFNAYTGSSSSQFSGTASLALTASYFSGSVSNAISASYALTASYALNGGVTQLLAGPNISLSPTNGLGQVTVSATLSGSTIFNTATGSYGSFYDTTIQTNPVANIARSMSFNSTDITNGVSISGSTSPFNTYIKITNAGVYNIQFSAQVDKTDSGTDEIDIWLRKNGINLTDTATKLTLTGNNTKVVAAWNWFVLSAANDYYQIIWASADTNIRLFAEPLSGIHPGIPSVIATVNRIDQFLSNTGSFSGSFTGSLTGSVTNYETAWTSYTPVWTAASINPVIGNGTIEGWYKVIGKTCFVRGNIAMGSTTTFGSGEWYVSMPFTASHADAILMSANLLDNGSAWYNALLNGARAGFNYKTAIQYQAVGGTANDVNATQPFTWANTDRFLWNGTYELI
jgi:hypothetical protein